MTNAATQAVLRAREALARESADAVYARLAAFGQDDPDGQVALECARLSLKLRQPDRALGHLEAANGRAHPADVMFETGRALNNLRRFAQAVDAFRRAVSERPQWVDAWANLAHVLRAAGRFDEALTAYGRALELAPGHARALAGAATLYAERGDLVAALSHVDRALAAQPDDPDLHVWRGQWLQSRGEPEAAVESLRRASELLSDAAVFSALGSALQSSGDLDGARAAYERALSLDPGWAPAAAALAGVLDLLGQVESAQNVLAKMLRAPVPPAVVVLAHANLSSQRRVSDAVLAQMTAALKDPATPPTLRSLIEFRVADARDQRDDTAGAFAAYARANAARRSGFDADALARQTDAIVARLRQAVPAASAIATDWRPVFIVGLPRTGTTLVEQVLAAHPAIAAAGEVRALALAARAGDAARSVDSRDAVAFVRSDYRARLTERVAEVTQASWCTDKMWQNFELLWLIRRAFPDAVVVHCVRDAMATGWSIFQRSFGAAPPPFASALHDIAAFMAHHHRVMRAWSEVGAPNTVTLRYESLVTDFETTASRLLGALGLDLHPDCVAFHRQSRIVTTQSFGQVSQPLYSHALTRWRRYATQLAPLADALAALDVPLSAETQASSEDGFTYN